MSSIFKYWTISLVLFFVSAVMNYDKNDEFYWFYIQLVDSKISLILFGNFAISSYLLLVYILQRLFIGDEIMEAERLVS